MKPVVDGIERKLSGELLVVRLNVQEAAGSELAAQYGASYTPTFILFDRQGTEVWRSVFQIDGETIERLVAR